MKLECQADASNWSDTHLSRVGWPGILKRDRETERQTDRQTDRETERQRDRQTDYTILPKVFARLPSHACERE